MKQGHRMPRGSNRLKVVVDYIRGEKIEVLAAKYNIDANNVRYCAMQYGCPSRPVGFRGKRQREEWLRQAKAWFDDILSDRSNLSH